MPSRRTHRSSRSRKQRGGFLDWLFGSSTSAANATTEKKNAVMSEEMLAPPVSPNAVPEVNGMGAPAAGGKRSGKSRKAHRKSRKTHRNRKASRKASRRH